MATITLTLSGTVKWVKRKKDEKYGNYSVDFYPTLESKKQIKESGLKITIKEDKDGELFYKFRRPDTKVMGNETVTFGPPSFFILDEDSGKPIPFDGVIGNGSVGKVKVQVYDIKSTGTKGHRWESLLVEDLVEFKSEGIASGDQLAPPAW
jgi:hypothetical protein